MSVRTAIRKLAFVLGLSLLSSGAEAQTKINLATQAQYPVLGSFSITAPVTGIGLAITQAMTTGTPQGVSVIQTATGTLNGGAGFNYNLFNVTSDNASTGGGFGTGLTSQMTFGGAAQFGGRIALQGVANLNGATNAANTNRNYVGGLFQGKAVTGDGGTNLGAGAQGAIFGFSAFGSAANGATNLLNVTGGEVNCALQTGSTAKYKTCLQLVQHASDAVAGGSVDAMLSISSQAGAAGMNNGIVFGDMSGLQPIKAAGTLIGINNPNGTTTSVTSGIDFSSAVFSSYAIRSPGFAVDNNGNISITSVNPSIYTTGTKNISILSGGGANTQLRIRGDLAAVNAFDIFGVTAGSGPILRADGADTNIPVSISSKGNSFISLQTELGAVEQVRVLDTASATRQLTLTGSNGGNPIVGSTAGNVAFSSPIANNTSGNVLIGLAAPTISSGFGTSPSIASNNGPTTFRLNVGTGGTATGGVIGLPTATNGWNCQFSIFNPTATNLLSQNVMTASSTTTVTITNELTSTGIATAWPASTVLIGSCFSY